MTSMRQPQTRPKRIQLSRKRGWRMPENTVKVDRSTKWGNPFIFIEDGTRAECVALFRGLLRDGAAPSRRIADYPRRLDIRADILRNIDQLRGKNLACWCRLDEPCHADVLIELAYAPLGGEEASN
jgi:hypothetical protein